MAEYTIKSIKKAMKKYGVDVTVNHDVITDADVSLDTPLNANVFNGFFTVNPDGYYVQVRLMDYNPDEGTSIEMIHKTYRTVKEAAGFIKDFYELMDIIPEIDFNDDNANNILDMDDYAELTPEQLEDVDWDEADGVSLLVD